MPTISFFDNCNRLDNYINNNNNIQYACGNPFIISIIIALLVIIIVNLNYNNCFSQIIYSILFILPLILLENKIIKYNYSMKRGGENPFGGTTIIKSGNGIIEPRIFSSKKKLENDINSNNDRNMIMELLEDAK